MRMRLRQISVVAALLLSFSVYGWAQGEGEPEPAPQVMRFVKRAIAWYPDSVFKLVSNKRYMTPSGAYRIVEVRRTCASQVLTGSPTVMIDEVANTVRMGGIGELPPIQEAGAGPEALRNFLSGFLPRALNERMGIKVAVEWDIGPRRPGALIPFFLVVDTGYGSYRRQAAVSADGKYLVMGSEMPLDQDPVAYRRRTLAESAVVQWDAGRTEDGVVEIVEFSDLECPACKGKWPIINMAMKKFEGHVRHGMVSFPLVMIHPWSFRAASASWCVGEQDPEALIPFKETFYGLQREMEVSLVTPTASDFVSGRGLDEQSFRECYLRPESIEAVHRQMSLGQEMNVRSTPTYFVNGWMIQVPDGSWFPALVERLLDGQEP